jgi:hypothetical protein
MRAGQVARRLHRQQHRARRALHRDAERTKRYQLIRMSISATPAYRDGRNSAARLVRITEHYVRMDYEGEGSLPLPGHHRRRPGRDPAQGRQGVHHAVRRHSVCDDDAGADDASLLRPLDRRSRDAAAAGEDRAEARRAGQSLSAQQSAGRGVRGNAGPNTLDDLLVSRPGGVVRTKTRAA